MDNKYYYVEIAEDALPFISDACKIAASFKVGCLDVLLGHLKQSYIERHGKQMTDEQVSQAENLLSILQRLVFDTTYGNQQIVHNLSPDADVFFDIMECVEYQMALDRGTEKKLQYPMHWNDEVEQIRFYCKKGRKSQRRKALPLFVQEQKVGRR